MADAVEKSSGLMWARPSAASHSSRRHAHLSEAGTSFHSNPGSECSMSWGELINTYLSSKARKMQPMSQAQSPMHIWASPTQGSPFHVAFALYLPESEKQAPESLRTCWIFTGGSLEVNLQPAPY